MAWRRWGMLSLTLVSWLAVAGCHYLTPAYWDCRRQWERHRAQHQDQGQSALTRRMIERGEEELRDAYLDVCTGRVVI